MAIDPKSKLSKELVAQEARFILDHLHNSGGLEKELPFEELRRLCEQSVSLRLLDYLNFLERFGYIIHDRNSQKVGISSEGERVVAGEKVAELVIDVVHHFRPLLTRMRPRDDGGNLHATKRPSEARDLIDDRYEKLKSIGSGGIGTVYLARQVQLGRNVALKEIRELFGFFTEPQRLEIIKRFDEEVTKAAKLSHPNIAMIIDGNTGRDFPYLVTEYVSGGNLRRILQLAEAIPPELSVKIFLQLLHALGHAHNRGVIHRGLKPENILFDASGNVRVSDFGMSRVVERDQSVIRHVYIGMGSVAYVAPELFTDPRAMGPQSDLYALGIIFYEMLARRLPGRRSPMPTKLHPTLPKIIDDLFDRLTQDELGDRYKSVDEVLEDFHQADASKAFLEPRGAVLFLESPLDKLQLKPVAPDEEHTTLATIAQQTSVERVEPGEDPLYPEPLAPIPTGPQPLTASAASALPQASATSGSTSLPLSSVLSGSSNELPPFPDEVPEDYPGEIETDDEIDRAKRRSRTRRPYSFQQRVKERDK